MLWIVGGWIIITKGNDANVLGRYKR